MSDTGSEFFGCDRILRSGSLEKRAIANHWDTVQRPPASISHMSDRLKFETVCPNNHNQTVAFDRKELEAALKSDALVFHCNTCDTDWPPSSEEIATFRKELSKN